MILSCKKNVFKVLLISFILTMLLSSCHSKYINLGMRTDGTVAWNNDSSAFAFVARTCLYRRPTGIAKFPDGGTTKNEYLDFSLYHFDIKQNKLTHLVSLNEFFMGSGYRWLSIRQVELSLNDTTLYYKLPEPYDYNLKYINEKEHPEFLRNIAKTYKININTLKKDSVSAANNSHLFNKKREIFSSSSAKKYLANLTYADWGIELKKIYPQSKNFYMDMIIEQGNKNTRECIFQQIAPGFTDKDKKYIVEKMFNKQQELLNDYETTSKKTDVYQKSLKKDRYLEYTKYLAEVYKKMNFPIPPDNRANNQKEVVERLKKYDINISDDFNFDKVDFIGQDYDAEFELKNADSTNIKKYKKWYREKVAYLLKNGWTSDSQTYDKDDTLVDGIVVTNMINFIWEHTELKKNTRNSVTFLELGISYDIKSKKYLDLSISEEIEQN